MSFDNSLVLFPMSLGEEVVYVEARGNGTSSEGSEYTSALDRVGDRVFSAFDRAKAAIIELAVSAADVGRAVGQRTGEPESIEIEVGVSFNANGDVILAGASAGATLNVKIIYKSR